MELKGGQIVIAGHVTEVYGPVQALRNYMIKKADSFIYITHPFSYSKLTGSAAEFYKNGTIEKTFSGHKRGANQMIQWLFDIFFNMTFMAQQKKKTDIFIAIDNLNAFTAILLKWFGKVDSVVYYIIDHTPRRFKNPVFNWFYEMLDGFACRHSDYIWSLSKRIAEVKNKKFRLKGLNNLVVPVGVELDKVDKFTIDEKVSKKTMVLMSMLDATKGVQLMIDSMRDIIKEVPRASLLIIGTGPYEPELKKQTKGLDLEEHVKFLGLMDHDSLFKFIPHHRIGLAPYIDDKNNYSWYADPTKPKEYLGCGLPLVITDVPWIAQEVEKRPMGVVCKYEKTSLTAACVKLLNDDEFYKICLKNSIDFAKELSWTGIYDRAFEQMKYKIQKI
jgi:glycosyltransferase involved in cell wall biosynthesis